MKTHHLIPILLLSAGLLGACESSYPIRQSARDNDIDNISRDVTRSEGASVHDPSTLTPPPVRPAYVQDR